MSKATDQITYGFAASVILMDECFQTSNVDILATIGYFMYSHERSVLIGGDKQLPQTILTKEYSEFEDISGQTVGNMLMLDGIRHASSLEK